MIDIEYPSGIINARGMVLHALHVVGLIEQCDCIIKGKNINTTKQTIGALKREGHINTNNGYLSLSEFGLSEYIRIMVLEPSFKITEDKIIDYFYANIDIKIGSTPIIRHFYDKGDLKDKRSLVTRILKILLSKNIIIECSRNSNYREYYLADSHKGKMFKKTKEDSDSLSYVFQKALPGTLTANIAGEKPFFC